MTRLLAAALTSAVVFAALVLAVDRVDFTVSGGPVLPLPEAGAAVGAQLADGTPVWVTRSSDGGRAAVVSAIALNATVVITCPGAWFTDPGPATRFDWSGGYRGGPSPMGLIRYPVQRVEGGLVVTGPGRALPRWERADEPPPPGPRAVSPHPDLGTQAQSRCLSHEGFHGDTLHHPLAADPVPVSAVVFDGGWHAVEGFLAAEDGRLRLCDEGPACGSDGRVVTGLFSRHYPWPDWTEGLRGYAEGRFLARAGRDGRFHDVAIVQRMLHPPREGPWGYLTEVAWEYDRLPADREEVRGTPASLSKARRDWELCLTDGRCWRMPESRAWAGIGWDGEERWGPVSPEEAARLIERGRAVHAWISIVDGELSDVQLSPSS